MQAVRRRDAIRSRAGRPRSGETPDRADQTHPTPHHYVVFRATTHADGSTIRHYQVPDVTTRLDEHGYNTWVSDHVPSGRETDLVSVLLIQSPGSEGSGSHPSPSFAIRNVPNALYGLLGL